MKTNTLLWLAALGAAIYFLMNRKATATGAAPSSTVNTGTATKAPPPWNSATAGKNDSVDGTLATVTQAVSTTAGALSNIYGLFGGNSKASGAVSPTTSGSGSGVPASSGNTYSTESPSSSTSDEPGSVTTNLDNWDTYQPNDWAGYN